MVALQGHGHLPFSADSMVAGSQLGGRSPGQGRHQGRREQPPARQYMPGRCRSAGERPPDTQTTSCWGPLPHTVHRNQPWTGKDLKAKDKKTLEGNQGESLSVLGWVGINVSHAKCELSGAPGGPGPRVHLGPCRLTEPPRATLGGAQATRPSWASPSAQQPEASSRTLSGASLTLRVELCCQPCPAPGLGPCGHLVTCPRLHWAQGQSRCQGRHRPGTERSLTSRWMTEFRSAPGHRCAWPCAAFHGAHTITTPPPLRIWVLG